MALPSKSRVIKLQDSETVHFLELYGGERVLYDATKEEYKDRDLRMAAAMRISEALKISGFGPKEVISKFKNLRSSYCQELKKISDSERSGAGTDDVYVPKVFWFELMNSFIRPFVQQRPTQSNLELKTEPCEDSHEEQSQSLHRSPDNDFNETIPCAPQALAETAETPRSTLKRKMAPQPSSSNIKKNLRDPQMDFMFGAIEKLYDISNRAALITKEDSYDCFGIYVSSMLRSIGPPTAMRLQEKITCLITKAMCPPSTPWCPPPSGQSTQSTSGTHSNMSDYSDD